ncbi:hypothetical protein [Methanobrevibacter sp.]
MKIKKPYHANDATIKYSSMAFRKRQHQYFNLPGRYNRRYPTEVVLRNMETGRMDELYSTHEGILIDLEDESEAVDEETLRKFSKYNTFGSFIYAMPMLTAVICHKNPENFPEEYENSPSDILRPKYIYFPQEELWEKYENIINKVNTNNELSDNEALDIAFIPRFISKKDGAFICESFAKLFKNAIIPDYELKRDVAVILMTMILTHIPDETKQNELLEAMEMEVYRDDMEELVYSIFSDELTKKDNQIKEKDKTLIKKENTIQQQGNQLKQKDNTIEQQGNQLKQKDNTIEQQGNQLKQKDNTIEQQGNQLKQKDQELKEIKKDYSDGLKELNKMDNLPPEAKKIINSMLLLHK